MSKTKLLSIVAGILIVVAPLIYLPTYLAGQIRPRFDPTKVEELKRDHPDQYKEFSGKFDEAVKKVKRDPKNYDAWFDIATISDAFGDYDLAVKAYKKAIDIKPASLIPWINITAIYRNHGQYKLAKEAYLKLIEVLPNDSQGYRNLADMYSQGQEGTLEDAKKILAEGIKETNDSGLKDLLVKLENGEKI